MINNFFIGGFNYLLQNGIVYSNSHYQHSNTETIVGDAILARTNGRSLRILLSSTVGDKMYEQ